MPQLHFTRHCGIVILFGRRWTDLDLSAQLRYSLTFVLLLASSGLCMAQEDPEISGTWNIVFTGETQYGRCGRELSYAELEIVGKLPDTKRPTYEANMTAWISTGRCSDVHKKTSKAKLVLRGTRVSLSYEREEWGSEMLVRDGNKMAGIDAEGVSIEWIQTGELPVSLLTVMVRQNIITEMEGSAFDELKTKIAATGVADEDIEQLMPKLIEGFADCAVDIAQVQAAVQRLPYDELLKMIDPISDDEANPRVVRKFNRQGYGARIKACYYELSDELGLL